jgi:hypothetical protein
MNFRLKNKPDGMKSWQLAKRQLAKGYSCLNSPNPRLLKTSPPAPLLEKKERGAVRDIYTL